MGEITLSPMKNTFTLLTIVHLVFLAFTASAQPYWSDVFIDPHKKFADGNFKSTLKKYKKTHKTIKKKFGDQRLLHEGWVPIDEARTYEAMGMYTEMERKLQAGVRALEKRRAENPEAYVQGIKEAAKIYIRYGSYEKAAQLLLPFREKMLAQKELPDYLAPEMRFYLAKAQMQQGYFEAADSLLVGLTELYRPLLQADYLSKEEKRHRQDMLAKMLLAPAESHTLHGDYRLALTELQGLESAIAALTPKDSEVFGEYLMVVGDNLAALQNFREADKYYRQATKEVKNARLMPNILVHDAKNRFAEGKERQAQDAAQSLKGFGKGVKSKENSYLAMSAVLEARFAYEKENFKKAQKVVDQVRTLPRSVLPREHPTRMEQNDLRKEIALAEQKWLEAKYAVNFGTEIHGVLYGTKSPVHTFRRLQKAHFYLRYTPEVKQASQEIQSINTQALLDNFSPAHPIHYGTLDILADLAQDEEDFQTAIRYRKRILQILSEKYGDNSGPAGKGKTKLAELYTITGQYTQADTLLQQARAQTKEAYSSTAAPHLEATQTYANLLDELGRYDEAEKLLRQYQRRTNSDEATEKLASLYARFGEFVKTEELLQEVVSRKTSLYGESSRALIRPIHELGKLTLLTGDFNSAQEYLTRAAEITEDKRGKNSLRYADIQVSLGQLHASIGDYGKAEKKIRSALEIYTQKLGDKHIRRANALTKLALIELYTEEDGNAEEVGNLLMQAKDIVSNALGQQHPLYAEALRNLGRSELREDNLDKAIQMLSYANTIWAEAFGAQNQNSGETLMLLGSAYSKKKDFKEAKKNYEEAEKILGGLFDQNHPSYVKALAKTAQMYYVSNDYKKANDLMEQATGIYFGFIRDYFPALSEGEKAKFWQFIRGDFEFFNSLAVSRADKRPDFLGKMYDYSLATKGILLSSSAGMKQKILYSKNTELKNTYRSWITAKERLKNLLTLDAGAQAEQQGYINETRRQVESLEKELSKSGGQDLFERFYSWEELRKSLNKDEAAVEIIRYRSYQEGFSEEIHYAALILSPKTRKAPRLVVFKNGNELEGSFYKNHRNSLRYELEDYESYERFWKPIADVLKEEGVFSRVYICPDGVYNQLNLSSLQIDEKNYLLDKQEIVTVTNGREIIQLKEADRKEQKKVVWDKNTRILLLGNPTFYSKEKSSEEVMAASRDNGKDYIVPLPGTAKEIEQISTLFDVQGITARTLTEKKAQEKELTSYVFGKSPQIIHIATHGFFGELSESQRAALQESGVLEQGYGTVSPLLRSGLLLQGSGDLLLENKAAIVTGNGILTAYEVMNLNFNDTELAVLSACETGRGEVQDGEGVVGLQRAFLVAGAEALIISLFKVSDEVTQELMVTFYDNWITQKMPKREAFLAAQRKIRRQYPEPIYWGAFMFLGI